MRDLVRLADDDATRAAIGDLLFESTRRDGKLPAAGDVRRRLGLPPGGSGETFAQAWDAWLAGKMPRKRRLITFNPAYAIELEPEVTPEAKRWTAAEVRAFLAASASDPLGLMSA